MYLCAAHPMPEGETSREGASAVLQLLQVLGEGYGLLCMYHCKVGIRFITSQSTIESVMSM